MHKGCILQLVSLGTLSNVTVVLGMRQSIAPPDLKKIIDMAFPISFLEDSTFVHCTIQIVMYIVI